MNHQLKEKRLFFGLASYKVCPNCGSTNLNHSSMWNGGYNYLCTQAVGRRGNRCYDCGKIYWDQTDNEYEATLPNWCKSHRQNFREKVMKRLTNIRPMGRFKNETTGQTYNVKKGRDPKRGTDHYFYLYRGKRQYIDDAEYFNSHIKISD